MAKRKRDPVKTSWKQKDWAAWRQEHASDYRTTRHKHRCGSCTRWVDDEGISCQATRCKECDALRSRVYLNKYKNRTKRLARIKANRARKKQNE